jgi:acetyl esterase/lipase
MDHYKQPNTALTSRRKFLKSVALASAVIAGAHQCRGSQKEPTRQTFTYKTTGGSPIMADVYRATQAGPRPVVLSIHGGALIMGNRQQVDRGLNELLLDAGYSVVSIDYRLAPETKVPAILEDVDDAYQWLRAQGSALGIDPERVAVMGGSAGGYLTLVSGFRFRPRPRALVSFWGYGNIAGRWLTEPDPFYCHRDLVTRKEAYAVVGGPPLSEDTGKTRRHRYYLYCRQQGIWSAEVTGREPRREPAAYNAFCPIRNVTQAYPPTLLIHGTKDTDVPYEQSQDMAGELKRNGVEHQFLTISDGGHGFAGVSRDRIAKTHEAVLAFLKPHLA